MARRRSRLKHVDPAALPSAVQRRDPVWIPMADGVQLAARVWLPKGAEREPVPAVLEYIPYRRRDGTAIRDSMMHPYFAGHGYASVRVDLRGSGDSGGVLQDEYLDQELDDGVAVIRWLAAQPWCDGQVGMIGISWGGFNGLQIAARTPPELKAVISVSSTDDRYSDDVHYMGGCLLGDNLSWASVMFSYNSCPPDPQVVGEPWRAMWLQRLEASGLWIDTWMRHQRRDEYWQHGSICEDYGRITAKVLAVSGWADGYSNAVFRMVEHMPGRCWGLIGPWSHLYPHLGEPGPAVGFLQHAVKWWDRWLKERDNGMEQEPAIRLWMQEPAPPRTQYAQRPGRWVAAQHWPSDQVHTRRFAFGKSTLQDPSVEECNGPNWLHVQSPLTVGLYGGKWCSYATGPDLPYDQRLEDGGSLVFDSEPLSEPLELMGAPVLKLALVSDQPVGQVAVRLSSLSSDDKATRITYGLLNLTHRDGHRSPEPLVPGKRYEVTVQLNDIAQVVRAGHRLRVAISTSYWPMAWPPPQPVRLSLEPAGCELALPVRPPMMGPNPSPFEPAEAVTPTPHEYLRPKHANWRVIHDLSAYRATLEVIKDDGAVYLEDPDLEMSRHTRELYSFVQDQFDTARGEVRVERTFNRPGWDIRTITRTVLTSDAANFYLRADLDAYEGDSRLFSRSWERTIPRDLV